MATYADPNNPSLSIDARPNAVSAASWILLLAALAALAFTGYFAYQMKQADADTAHAKDGVAAHTQELASLKPVADTLVSRNVTGTNLTALFSSQKRWETVLSNVEAHLYKRTIVTSLDMSQTGAVTLGGMTDSFDSYAKLYASLTDDTGKAYFSSVKPLTVAKFDNSEKAYPDLPATAVQYTLSFTLTPAMFQLPSAK